MSLCHDGASPCGPDGIRDDSLVRRALAWTVSSVLASVLMMTLMSRTTPLNAWLDKRGTPVESSTRGSMISTLGEMLIFILRMASSSRCVHHLYHTERTAAADGSGVEWGKARKPLERIAGAEDVTGNRERRNRGACSRRVRAGWGRMPGDVQRGVAFRAAGLSDVWKVVG